MKAVYFAWVRERIGLAEEELTPPASVETVEQLVDWLAARGEGYAAAFANRKSVRAALDKMHVTTQTPIAAAREIAFFPPMTGG
jgi:molybdopterin synthase sulfur carrier subunit